MSEKIDALQGEESQTASLLAVWRSFVEHPGWDLFKKLLEDQSNNRRGEVLLKPLAKMDDALSQEFMKGEISGLMLATVSPHSVIETLQIQLKTIRTNLERENEVTQARADDAGRSRVDDERFSSE